MVIKLYKIIQLFVIILLSGCGSTPLNYQMNQISVNEAYNIIDQMIMTQHKNWKPDYFVITDKYLGWDYGSVSSGSANAVIYNGLAFGSTNSTIRNVSDRVYFSNVKRVQLYDWKRKFKQWYTVALVGKNDKIIKHVLRSRNLTDAQYMVDALTALLNDRSSTE